MTPTLLDENDLKGYSKKQRLQLVNALPGIRPAVLVGTLNSRARAVSTGNGLTADNSNLAVFSSLVHLGSDPALFAIFIRPEVNPKTPDEKFERQTLDNIRKHRCFTISQIPLGDVEAAHRCSAPYKRHQSEFVKADLPCVFLDDFRAPFVESSPLSFGLQLVREYRLDENGVTMVIGELKRVRMLEDFDKNEDHLLHPEHIGTAGVFGLGSYCRVQEIAKLPKATLE